MNEEDTLYWDKMVEVYIKDSTLSEISYRLAGLIKYYALNWTPERVYVCEKILKKIKIKLDEKNNK